MQGPASITVTPVAMPPASNIWVIPSFLPNIDLISVLAPMEFRLPYRSQSPVHAASRCRGKIPANYMYISSPQALHIHLVVVLTVGLPTATMLFPQPGQTG